MTINRLAQDLDYILENTQSLWQAIKNQALFITGGTGFFGSWLLESFIWANEKLSLNAQATILTRDPKAFQHKIPHLALHPAIKLYQGDVRHFTFPQENFAYLLHGATEASAKLNDEAPQLMVDTIVQGTQHVLEFARRCHAKQFLFISSGAVYGKQPGELSRLDEDYHGTLDQTSYTAYGLGKCAAEYLSVFYARQYNLPVKIARCFAFVGPYLPLDRHFAIGNFIADALRGNTITIQGDGTPYRSYLYAADLVIWLWHILFRGQSCRPYNVGSDQAVSIAETAQAVANGFPEKRRVNILTQPTPGKIADRYVPCIARAKQELQLKIGVDLNAALKRTINWNKEVL